MGKYVTTIKTSAALIRDNNCCKSEEQADIEQLQEDLTDLSATVAAKKGVAVADTATAAGATYDQAQVQSIITELRALKTSLKNGGIIA